MQQPPKSNVEEPKDVPPPTVLQPETAVEHSPISKTGGDAETRSNASEQVADEVLVPDPEPTVSAQNSTKSSSAQDELVDRAIGMIRSALENGSA
jgi:hypothetical protein